MSDKPWCCKLECGAAADVAIYGGSGYHEDDTHSCFAHVGEMLGTPDWLLEPGMPGPNKSWTVVLLNAPVEVHKGGPR